MTCCLLLSLWKKNCEELHLALLTLFGVRTYTVAIGNRSCSIEFPDIYLPAKVQASSAQLSIMMSLPLQKDERLNKQKVDKNDLKWRRASLGKMYSRCTFWFEFGPVETLMTYVAAHQQMVVERLWRHFCVTCSGTWKTTTNQDMQNLNDRRDAYIKSFDISV